MSKINYFWPIIVLCLIPFSIGEEDLYKVLGVSRSSTRKEIKQAYKQLAKEWHPDKNQDPGANEKFMKINEAYETLGDDEKRREYDRFGRSTAQQGQRRGGHQQHFDSFFSGFRFNFGGVSSPNEELIDKFRINLRTYTERVLPSSYTRPYFLYAYAEFCFNCVQVETIFDKIVSDLENIGMGISTVHVQLSRDLTHKLKITYVPSLLMVVSGKIHYFSSKIDINNIRLFVRASLPADLVQTIDDTNYEEFLSGWQDNKMRMVFVDSKDEPSLRYLLPAFAAKDRVVGAYINSRKPSSFQFRRKYGINDYEEALLMFNENTKKPCAHVSMTLLAHTTISEVIAANRYLLLPRITSKQVFDDLCPVTNGKKRSMCIVLLTQNIPEHKVYTDSFRKHASRNLHGNVRYTYIYENTQKSFVHKITSGQGAVNSSNGSLKVALLWRKSSEVIQFDWSDIGWFAEGVELLQSQSKLALKVDQLLTSTQSFPYDIPLPELRDEYGKSIFVRILNRLGDYYDIVYDKFTSLDEVSVIQLFTSVMCCFVLIFLVKSAFIPQQNPGGAQKKQRYRDDQWSGPPQGARKLPVVNMFPANGTTFREKIINTEKGVRSIMVMVTEGSKNKLIQEFALIVEPYARSAAFQFVYLQLEDDISWYRTLLEQAFNKTINLANINPHNCVGTVLAINGPRKYFCIYHPKAKSQKRRRHQVNSQGGSGEFMGFEDTSSEESEAEPEAEMLFESDLLAGLGVWMDRLCEGTLQRIRMDSWPEMK